MEHRCENVQLLLHSLRANADCRDFMYPMKAAPFYVQGAFQYFELGEAEGAFFYT